MTTQEQQSEAYALSVEIRAEVDRWLKQYPPEQKASAVLAALHAVQHADGYVSVEAMDAVAAYLGMPKVSVYEVSSFYSMIETKPVGRNTVAICTNISCMLCGADNIVEHVEKKLGTKLGKSTLDGRIYLKLEEECLAACVGGPMMAVNGHYHENLTIEKVDRILDDLK